MSSLTFRFTAILHMPYACHALYTGRYAPLNRSKMANRWNIPAGVETSVKTRDLECVYCRVAFSKIHESRRTMPTWEHIVNDIRLNSAENIALCCYSCNASKGAKSLEDWLKSKYCVLKCISRETVGLIVQKVLDR